LRGRINKKRERAMERNVGIRGRKTDGKIGNLKEIEGRRSRRGKVNEWSKGGEGGWGGGE